MDKKDLAHKIESEGLTYSILDYFNSREVEGWPFSDDFKRAWARAAQDLRLISDELELVYYEEDDGE